MAAAAAAAPAAPRVQLDFQDKDALRTFWVEIVRRVDVPGGTRQHTIKIISDALADNFIHPRDVKNLTDDDLDKMNIPIGLRRIIYIAAILIQASVGTSPEAALHDLDNRFRALQGKCNDIATQARTFSVVTAPPTTIAELEQIEQQMKTVDKLYLEAKTINDELTKWNRAFDGTKTLTKEIEQLQLIKEDYKHMIEHYVMMESFRTGRYTALFAIVTVAAMPIQLATGWMGTNFFANPGNLTLRDHNRVFLPVVLGVTFAVLIILLWRTGELRAMYAANQRKKRTADNGEPPAHAPDVAGRGAPAAAAAS